MRKNQIEHSSLSSLPSHSSSVKEKIASCPICLSPISEFLAKPNKCAHDFCYDCLTNWSQYKVALCPVCKKPFDHIICYSNDTRNVISLEKNADLEDIEEEPKTMPECMACGLDSDEANLLICDFCQYNICHTYCDNLDEVPQGEWICKQCQYAINHLDKDQGS